MTLTAVTYAGYILADIPQDDMPIKRVYSIDFTTIFVVLYYIMTCEQIVEITDSVYDKSFLK